MYGYIYKITIENPQSHFNNCYYIGQHISEIFDEKYFGSGRLLVKYIKKHGTDKLKREILCECESLEELNLQEKNYIGNLFDTDNFYFGGKCLNLKEGGKNAKASIIAKIKMSEKTSGKNNGFYGKHHTEETKKKLSEKASGKNNPMYGKTHSEEAREKLRQYRIGRKHNPETLVLYSQQRKGKHWWTNGNIEKFTHTCPEGFRPGRIKKCCDFSHS